MTTFAQAIDNLETRTENGMKALVTSGNALTNLFFKIGASRGKDIIPEFVSAFVEDEDKAIRILLWARDIRQGAGERQLFRNVLKYIINNNSNIAKKLIPIIPEIGRADDLFTYVDSELESEMFEFYKNNLNNGLFAKWAPRKKEIAIKFRNYLGWSPKHYRKTLVENTKVVETQMCAREWDKINFEHVPALAHSRYKKAFFRNCGDYYKNYVEKLKKNEVKINAAVVYPYDVIKTISDMYENYDNKISEIEKNVIIAQWNSLPNYVENAKILPMVDVSRSMDTIVAGSNTTALKVAVSLGLYFADKNEGAFKDIFLTFSTAPVLLKLKGNIIDKLYQMTDSTWHTSTNLHAAFNKVLDMAIRNNIQQEEMPETIIIFSDMAFNKCVVYDNFAIEMIKRKYEESGYNIPNVIFWNINAKDNYPVKFNEKGVGLVSGFSHNIVKNIIKCKDINPWNIMLETIMNERYNWNT